MHLDLHTVWLHLWKRGDVECISCSHVQICFISIIVSLTFCFSCIKIWICKLLTTSNYHVHCKPSAPLAWPYPQSTPHASMHEHGSVLNSTWRTVFSSVHTACIAMCTCLGEWCCKWRHRLFWCVYPHFLLTILRSNTHVESFCNFHHA